MLDHTDMLILEELRKNSRITMKELGEKVHLTGQAAAARVAKLEDNGVIKEYTIHADCSKLGLGIHAFINIMMEIADHRPYISFIHTQNPYVINNYRISGESCYLLECRFPSNEVLTQFLDSLNRYANYKLSIVITK